MKKYLVMLTFLCIVFTQYDFNLINQNPNSESYGEGIGPDFYLGKVTLYYFGHQNWGLCSSRFGSLNSLFIDNFSDYFEFQIIGVGKSQYSSSTENFVNDRVLPFVEDLSPEHTTWSEWDANQRDLIFLDKSGDFFVR